MQKISIRTDEILSKIPTFRDIPKSDPEIQNLMILDPELGFILAIVFFNLPFFYYYSKQQKKDLKLLLLYLSPIITYAILSFAFRYISAVIYSPLL